MLYIFIWYSGKSTNMAVAETAVKARDYLIRAMGAHHAHLFEGEPIQLEPVEGIVVYRNARNTANSIRQL